MTNKFHDTKKRGLGFSTGSIMTPGKKRTLEPDESYSTAEYRPGIDAGEFDDAPDDDDVMAEDIGRDSAVRSNPSTGKKTPLDAFQQAVRRDAEYNLWQKRAAPHAPGVLDVIKRGADTKAWRRQWIAKARKDYGLDEREAAQIVDRVLSGVEDSW